MARILLIDDERDALDVLEWVLKDRGHDVRAVCSASDALEVARTFKPTLLVTDYFLRTELSGLDVLRLLRVDAPDLRAVLMTGMNARDLQPQLDDIGNIEVIAKPFNCEQIVARVQPPAVRANAPSSPHSSV